MSELHDGLVIQTCVQNPDLIICFCFNQTDLWLDFCQGDKHVRLIKMFYKTHRSCFRTGGFKWAKKWLTALAHNLVLQQIAFYMQRHLLKSSERKHNTHSAIAATDWAHRCRCLYGFFFMLQMISSTLTLYYCLWMSFWHLRCLCASLKVIPSPNSHCTDDFVRVCVCMHVCVHVCLFSQSNHLHYRES